MAFWQCLTTFDKYLYLIAPQIAKRRRKVFSLYFSLQKLHISAILF